MLSPSIRQVIHALLTRPPLIHASLGFSMDPFDLHVLGTPPAFILSQDQTLMLKCFLFDSCTSQTGNRKQCFLFIIRRVFRRFYFLKVLFSEQFSRIHMDAFHLEFSGLHYCLFVKVHFVVLVWHNSVILSLCKAVVKNFFIFSFFACPPFRSGISC